MANRSKSLDDAPWALVSGASSGIGRATALRLADAGYHLVLLARRRERLQQLEAEILQTRGHCQIELAVLDLQNAQSVERWAALNQRKLSRVELLVNNAGLAKGTDSLVTSKRRDWDAMIDTNIKGLLVLTRALLPGMRKHARGHVINIGSVAGRWVYPGGAVYCATKFAVRALSEGLRMDVAGSGIRVTLLEPGMLESEFSVVRLGSKEAAAQVYQGMKPLLPEDIADMVHWVATLPQHVNVQELVVFPTDQAAVGQVWRRSSQSPSPRLQKPLKKKSTKTNSLKKSVTSRKSSAGKKSSSGKKNQKRRSSFLRTKAKGKS